MLVLSIGYCYLGLYDSSGGGLVQLVSGNDTGHVNKVILHPCSPVSSEMNILSFTRGMLPSIRPTQPPILDRIGNEYWSTPEMLTSPRPLSQGDS